MAPKPKRQFFVYKMYEDGRYEFLTMTQAVSEAQAVNNARWNYFGETPECDFDFIFMAVLSDSAEHSAIKRLSKMRHEENTRFRQITHPPAVPRPIEQMELSLF
ncbi:MAG: hypothetical protein AAB642_01905 [Patescibacteria group bacterium]